MAAPPPTFNPDRRPLPDGWITRYDDNYRAWYYVDTRAHPPRSSWEHPLGAARSDYSPPSNPPPTRGAGFGAVSSASTQVYPHQQPQSPSYAGTAAPAYNPSSSFPGGYNNPQGRSYPPQQQPPTQYQGQPPYGGSAGEYGNPGNPGWPQQGWQQQPPTQLGYQSQPASQAVQQPPRGSGRSHGGGGGGIGLGGAAALGVGGLVAGGLLANAFEHHEERVRDDAYEQGYENAEDDGFNNGGDFVGDNNTW